MSSFSDCTLGSPSSYTLAQTSSAHVATSLSGQSLSGTQPSPPDYKFVARPFSFTSQTIPGDLTSQSTQNREKQALRDAWARQNLSSEMVARAVPQNTRSGSRQSQSQLSIKQENQGSEPSISPSQASSPAGMDVREALAKCEDPALGWSMTFWVTIADPVTQNVFFACPASGHCSWDPPVGAFVVPRSPDGEWWELADSKRNNRSYYYNTLSGKTQWTRPTDGVFVIPLGLIQRNALPARPDRSSADSLPYRSQRTTRSPGTEAAPMTPCSVPHPSRSPHTTSGRQVLEYTQNQFYPDPQFTAPISQTELLADNNSANLPAGAMKPITSLDPSLILTTKPGGPLSIVEEISGDETDLSENLGSGKSWWEKRKSKLNRLTSAPKRSNVPPARDTLTEEEEVTHQVAMEPSVSALSMESQPEPLRGPNLPIEEPSAPIFVEHMRTKRMSTGLHPLLPAAVSSEIQNFQSGSLASKYFATKRSGMLRSRMPLERIMEWQKQPLTSPLLVLSKSLGKEAITTFKVIQHVMGEREKPVEQAKPMAATSKGTIPGAEVVMKEKMVVLEEIRWITQLGCSEPEIRDEIFSQLVKQLTKNPDHDAIVLGFQLFCVLVNSFTPSKKFAVFVASFLQKEGTKGPDSVSVMAKYCSIRLQLMMSSGSRTRMLTTGEIEHASDAAFHPSVYGESLNRIMELQVSSYPELKVPVILPFLANGILALGGLSSEGIFRVPGDHDCVSELKSRIDRGDYRLTGIDDPHVAASLFKLWLRQLEEPVVPTHLYNAALSASKSPAETIKFVTCLPALHRRVLLFVISFAQMFLHDSVIATTKMTPHNLALILAPNILRTTSDHLATVFTNSSFESKFVHQLLEHMRPDQMDPDYIPTHKQAFWS